MNRMIFILILSVFFLSACGSSDSSSLSSSESTITEQENIESVNNESENEEKIDNDSHKIKIDNIEDIKKICNEHLIEIHDDFENTYIFKTKELDDKQWTSAAVPGGKIDRKEMLIVPALFFLGDCSDGDFFLTIQYHGNSWLFINSMKIKVKDNIEEISLSDPKHSTSGDIAFEKFNLQITDTLLNSLRQAVKENDCTIRFNGNKGVYDFTFSPEHLEQIKYIIDAYDQIFKMEDNHGHS